MTKRASITCWKRVALAALLAYALVLQTVLVSLAGASHAVAAAGPEGVLCLQDGQTAPDHSPAASHDGLCCLVGCHGSGAAGPAPVAVSVTRLKPASAEAVQPPSFFASLPTPKILPLGSRAPPRLG
ncbi:hypothetical protein AB4Y85_19075 [Microvirga sp. 2YAF29]|uniref:hypothetical protein n=1 Tax=Microvirga sp. 2YAF29 TaxID=3233031 RepID=UPI003F9C2EB1